MSEITRRSLVVNLTDQEITDCSKELARITTLQAEIEEEKKVVTSSYKEKLDRCISESRSLARKISTRQDFREVDCEWQPSYDERIKRLIRLDTYEEIEVRKLTNDELQEELPLEPVVPAVCPKCDGDGIYYDNDPENEEYERYCDCPAGKKRQEEEERKPTPVEPGPASLCATCQGACEPESSEGQYVKYAIARDCADYTAEPTSTETERRDGICNEWRGCGHTFKCFGPANEETGICFKQIDEAKEVEKETPTDDDWPDVPPAPVPEPTAGAEA